MNDYDLTLEDKTYDWITWAHDGPVTDFVLISRALRVVQLGIAPPDDAANALWRALNLEGREERAE